MILRKILETINAIKAKQDEVKKEQQKMREEFMEEWNKWGTKRKEQPKLP